MAEKICFLRLSLGHLAGLYKLSQCEWFNCNNGEAIKLTNEGRGDHSHKMTISSQQDISWWSKDSGCLQLSFNFFLPDSAISYLSVAAVVLSHRLHVFNNDAIHIFSLLQQRLLWGWAWFPVAMFYYPGFLIRSCLSALKCKLRISGNSFTPLNHKHCAD